MYIYIYIDIYMYIYLSLHIYIDIIVIAHRRRVGTSGAVARREIYKCTAIHQ